MGGINARIYLICFLAAAASAAAPAEEEAHWVTNEFAKMSTMVASQERQRPSRQGISVRPSGLLPSVKKVERTTQAISLSRTILPLV